MFALTHPTSSLPLERMGELGDTETHDLAVVISENVYLNKVLAYTHAKNLRLQEHLRVVHVALQTLHAMSLKPTQQNALASKLSHQMEKLFILEENLDNEIQANGENDRDTAWLQTHINYLKEENRLTKLSIGTNSSKLNSEIQYLLQEHKKETSKLWHKSIEAENIIFEKDSQISALEMKLEAHEIDLKSCQQELEKEREVVRKLQLASKEKEEQNKRLVDLCNKLEHNRSQLLKIQERQEEERMSIEEEATKNVLQLQKMQEELSYVKHSRTREMEHLQEQLLMYEEKFSIMETRLQLQEQAAARLPVRAPSGELKNVPANKNSQIRPLTSISTRRHYLGALKK